MNDAVVDVWHFDLAEAEKDIRHYENLLDAGERKRAECFTAPRARGNYLLTRGRLKELLARYLGAVPAELTLTASDYGKPRLSGTVENRDLVFNVSHAGNVALLAISRDTALGVDVEPVRERRDLDGLARTCLDREELARWRECPQERSLSEFIRLWVCKEAFVKAVGQGISLGLNQVGIRPDFTGFERLPKPYSPVEQWRLTEWTHGNYYAALVFSGVGREIRILGNPPIPDRPFHEDIQLQC
jgi:4'-phosphopantetheinyl transferase